MEEHVDTFLMDFGMAGVSRWTHCPCSFVHASLLPMFETMWNLSLPLLPGGNPKEAVTDSNKFAYAKKKVKWALYKSRMRGLSFIREAFWNFISMSQFRFGSVFPVFQRGSESV